VPAKLRNCFSTSSVDSSYTSVVVPPSPGLMDFPASNNLLISTLSSHWFSSPKGLSDNGERLISWFLISMTFWSGPLKAPIPSGRPGTLRPSFIGSPFLEIILYENPSGRSKYPFGSVFSGSFVVAFDVFDDFRVHLDSAKNPKETRAVCVRKVLRFIIFGFYFSYRSCNFCCPEFYF